LLAFWVADRDAIKALTGIVEGNRAAQEALKRIVDNNSTDTFSVLLRLPPSLHGQVKKAAAQGGAGMNAWITAAIERVLTS